MLRYLLLFLFLFNALFVCSQEERKFQLWNGNYAVASLNQKNTIEVAEKVYFTPKSNSVDMKYADLWMKHKCSSRYQYGGGFRLNSMKSEDGYKSEQRLMVLSEYMQPLNNFKLKFTGRFAYRMIERTKNHFRFWQKIDLNFPPVTKYHLRFFTYEESFIKLTSDNLHLARVHAGVEPFSRTHFKIKVYYSLEKKKSSDVWNTTNIVGMNMYFTL